MCEASIEIYLNRCFRMFYVYLLFHVVLCPKKLTLHNFLYETILKPFYLHYVRVFFILS
jgi:hypothetical protein